jgi:membrane protease YdiL (CAAX protease family)
MVFSLILGYVKGKEYKAAGMSYEEGLELLKADQAAMTGIILLISAVLTLLIYFIVEKVKKSSIFKEADIKPATGKQIGLSVVGALGAMFFMNFMLTILPIPQDLLGDLTSGVSKLTAYPFWQAILANALLIPIMEEVLFRGYIFSRLEKAMPSIVAALISSVVFGICHGGLVWAIWAFLLGMFICVVRIKSRSIVPGIIIHIIMNTYAMVVSYFPVLENITYPVMYTLTAVGGILMAVYVVGILKDKNYSDKEQAKVAITESK